ncbi:MAG: tetratricopeptide repeat protein [Oscillospiraceae bacterium]|nr:tetratricopeptide repeat protein [Oscillospiraceae bacterium]
MALQVKTRGNVSPQGKPRVYFCCHPADFGAFFDAVSDEILAKQNCAVWYVEKDGTDENFRADLERMNLFVMPVTTRLLTTENPALEEFRFAVAHHIPVLPLMQESGLEAQFNKICGDLQFLDKYAKDDTAISYDEKLTNYLNSVLIGDELAAQIRAAFDAYIFLSYRKKDRRYAQELMKLIHKNDFCRDIAIWYDEFLTPGENFNDSIKEALEKSGLFVLTVTPNLVNEQNYIMTTEYPMAQELHKIVLPAEMVCTDKNLLTEKYPGIEDCTDAHDDPAMTAMLLRAVERLALKENDKDPRHNFFMGLAYLSGIDVEVDHERAAELIMSAAEDGLVEAAAKLTGMYREGLGVARNFEAAIRWQDHKISLLKAAYEENGTQDSCHDLCWANLVCGDWYRELGKLPQARRRYAIALTTWEDHMERQPSDSVLQDVSVAAERLGDLCKDAEDLDAAFRYYEKSLSIREKLAENEWMLSAQYTYAVALEKMGTLKKAKGDLAGARSYYERFLAAAETLVKRTQLEDVQKSLAAGYYNMGDICARQGDLASAKAYHDRSLAVAETLAAETGSVQARRDLSVSYHGVGDVLSTAGEYEAAKPYYAKALALTEALAEETGSVQARQDLSYALGKLGNTEKNLKHYEKAKAYYEKSLAMVETLAEETGLIQMRRNVAVLYNDLGDVCTGLEAYEQARTYYGQALAIAEHLAETVKTIQIRRDLMVSYLKMGEICKESGERTAAKKRFGRLFSAAKDIAAGLEYYEKALAIAEAMVQELDSVQAWDDLGVACVKCLTGCLRKDKQQYYLNRAIEIYEMLCKRCPGVRRYREYLAMLKK